jgi:Bacterial transcriptional activator domain
MARRWSLAGAAVEARGGVPNLGSAGGARRRSAHNSAAWPWAGAPRTPRPERGQGRWADCLIDDLWGEIAPSTARTALQGLVFDLRKRLEPSRRRGELPTLLRTAPPGYLLAVEPTCVDANRFRRLVEEARAGEAAERAAKLREALDLWRGRALVDFTTSHSPSGRPPRSRSFASR